MRRVGHSIVKPGSRLDELPEQLRGARWDMVELDVMTDQGKLVVAHDPSDLTHPEPVGFAEALEALRAALPEAIRLDVDIKGVGYELKVLEVLRSLGLVERTLVSTMEPTSLRVLRQAAPELQLGLSVPRVRRNYLAHPLTRPAAKATLIYMRRALPRQAAAAVRSGLADAIMAHWGLATRALVEAVKGAGGELYIWTVDDPERLVAIARLGVTGVITNEGDVFARAGLGGP